MATRSITFCYLLFLPLVTASAQQLIVEERTIENEESTQLQSWTARVDQDMDYCMDTYTKFIKELFNTKVDKRGKTILVAEKTVFPELSKLRLDQRAIFVTESSGTAISFTFSPGYDIHFGSETFSTEFKKAENFVKGYVRYHYKTFYNEGIKSIQDQIKSKQNDIETNVKRSDRNAKTIADNKSDGETDKIKARNDKLQREIESYKADTENKGKEIAALEEDLTKLKTKLSNVEEFK
jgi:LPS O-antigen subunit length determinant protein (WzzB/FepE family)